MLDICAHSIYKIIYDIKKTICDKITTRDNAIVGSLTIRL